MPSSRRRGREAMVRRYIYASSLEGKVEGVPVEIHCGFCRRLAGIVERIDSVDSLDRCPHCGARLIPGNSDTCSVQLRQEEWHSSCSIHRRVRLDIDISGTE